MTVLTPYSSPPPSKKTLLPRGLPTFSFQKGRKAALAAEFLLPFSLPINWSGAQEKRENPKGGKKRKEGGGRSHAQFSLISWIPFGRWGRKKKSYGKKGGGKEQGRQPAIPPPSPPPPPPPPQQPPLTEKRKKGGCHGGERTSHNLRRSSPFTPVVQPQGRGPTTKKKGKKKERGGRKKGGKLGPRQEGDRNPFFFSFDVANGPSTSNNRQKKGVQLPSS